MTAKKALEAYARARMARGELLTWRYDEERREVTLFVPDDVDVESFPSEVAGVPTHITRLPRPLNQDRYAG